MHLLLFDTNLGRLNLLCAFTEQLDWRYGQEKIFSSFFSYTVLLAALDQHIKEV